LQIQAAGALAEEARYSEDGLLLLRPAFLGQVYRGGLDLYVDDDLFSMASIDWDFDILMATISGRLIKERRVLLVVGATHQESVALLDALNKIVLISEIWHPDKPGALGRLALWEIQEIKVADGPADS
jgi:hypothetical protein